ncbi:MAG: NAD-dependent epimerase/dehydratase family protein [Muribaculaceae bacterium]|nr:NAD-dependent epimerase/dehydratase family protein [Muribaculaceae bacterium]
MKILVTGAKGFVGKNLCWQLKNIKEGKARNYQVVIDEVFEYDIDSTPDDLQKYCREADFVFNLAGVNRPENPEDFRKGNFGFASTLLETLKSYGNRCPIMLSSSIQATMIGRYAGHPYGESKKAGEELFFDYSRQTGANVLVYRFPNIFGKWCRPNYNSAIATFCNNIANDLPIQVNDPTVELELVYIDDLVEELIGALGGQEHHCEFDGLDAIPTPDGRYCHVPVTYRVSLGTIVEMLHRFSVMNQSLDVPYLQQGSFEKKLYATYLSYLPKHKMIYDLKMNVDQRGSFTEIVHTSDRGQFSVNISKPGITKGQHWHHTKVEKFVVVSGHGLIQLRQIDSDEVINFEVSGDRIQVVEMIPGYTHNIINLSDTQDLVTLMWCNENFDPNHPDTYFNMVE